MPPAVGPAVTGGPHDHLLTYNQIVVDERTDATVDDLFRRTVHGTPSVSRLAAAYPMSFAAVQKHVAVLERAGLVTKERHGREQLVRSDPDAVRRARLALEELEAAWRGRVDRMALLLAQGPDPDAPTPPKGRQR